MAVALCFSTPIAVSATVAGPWVLPPVITGVVCTVVACIVAIGWRRLLVIGSALATLATTFIVYRIAGPALGVDVTPSHLQITPMMFAVADGQLADGLGVLSFALILASTVAVWRNTDVLVASRTQLHRYLWRLRQITSVPSTADRDTPS
ncbi:MAG: hypothetical protein GY884_22990 [Proteobacteria bacterium]|nr:hypothetical protein [Pseudomonadota bacterium]